MRLRKSTSFGITFLLFICAVFVSSNTPATELFKADEAIVNTGHIVYSRNCAVCHGPNGDGDGPYATLLRKSPSDLTVLAKNNHGTFPFEKVIAVISGNELFPAHGTREMPIWGQVFADEASLLGVKEQTLARARILEIIAYLQHVQKK